MKQDESKIMAFFYNKFVLLLTPYLVFISLYMSYFVRIEKYNYIMPLSALYEYYLLMFLILVGYNLIVSLITKNNYLSWLATTIITLLIYCFYNIFQLIIAMVIGLVLVFLLRKLTFKGDKILVGTANVFMCVYFLCFFVPTIFEGVKYLVHINNKKADYTVVVDDSKTIRPNIYYVHCDGMMSMEAMNKYFKYEDTYLNDYLVKNNFMINRNAFLVSGHRTQRALVALFNPYYYDNKEKAIIEELDTAIKNDDKTIKNYITYGELRDKRMNSEFLRGLASAGYTTYGIGLYNQYTSINTDYYYYYNYYKADVNHLGKNLTLKKIDKNTKKKDLERFINMQILGNLYLNPKVFSRMDYMKFLKGTEEVKTSDLDLSDYEYLNSTPNEKVKMLIGGLNDIYTNGEERKFVFVDFDLNHLYISYDKDGNEEHGQNNFVDGYRENYIYLSHLLVDVVEYINNNDPNSIIILQGDHGIHVLGCDNMMEDIGITKDECSTIRDSTMSAIYVPKEYQLGGEEYLNNPLNFSRYIINNYVGDNYKYIQ